MVFISEELVCLQVKVEISVILESLLGSKGEVGEVDLKLVGVNLAGGKVV